MALRFGGNDFGSAMIEENVVSQAGAVFKLSADDIERYVRQAGFVPRRRNMRYELLPESPEADQPRTRSWRAPLGASEFAPPHPTLSRSRARANNRPAGEAPAKPSPHPVPSPASGRG